MPHKLCLVYSSLILTLVFENPKSVQQSFTRVSHGRTLIVSDVPIKKCFIFIESSWSKKIPFPHLITIVPNVFSGKTIYSIKRLGFKNSSPFACSDMKYVFYCQNWSICIDYLIRKLSIWILLTTKISDILIVKIINRNHISSISEIRRNPEKKRSNKENPNRDKKEDNKKPVSLFEKDPGKTKNKIFFTHVVTPLFSEFLLSYRQYHGASNQIL